MSEQVGRKVAGRAALRVAQTPRTFTNWPSLLTGLAAEKLGRGPDVLHFETRVGLRIDAPNRPGARVPIYEIFAEDCYRLNWYLGAFAGKPMNVLDIGGHVGTFACRLAQLYPQATVWSFEPSATTADFYRRNVEQNGLTGRVRVSQAAVAAESGTAIFDDNGAGSGTNGLVSGDHRLTAAQHNEQVGRTVEVQTYGLDDIVAEYGGTIDVMKIDCEGAEYDLVYNSKRENWLSVQRLVLEYHAVEGQSWDELRAWFGEVGLNVVRHEPVNAGLGTAWLSREPLPAEH